MSSIICTKLMVKLLNKLCGKKEESKKAPAPAFGGPPLKAVAKKPPTSAEVFDPEASDRRATACKEEKKAAKAESKLLIPHVTEKASLAGSLGRYIFRVPASANKINVGREGRRVYKVKAVSVNLINVPGKERRVGRTVGFRPGYRKAIIKLAKGQTIELK